MTDSTFVTQIHTWQQLQIYIHNQKVQIRKTSGKNVTNLIYILWEFTICKLDRWLFKKKLWLDTCSVHFSVQNTIISNTVRMYSLLDYQYAYMLKQRVKTPGSDP